MINGPEKKLIEALKNVDAHGDVAPPHVHDPMTMVLRENAIQTNLMRWDDVRDRYVLTGAGRRRISARGHAQASDEVAAALVGCVHDQLAREMIERADHRHFFGLSRRRHAQIGARLAHARAIRVRQGLTLVA